MTATLGVVGGLAAPLEALSPPSGRWALFFFRESGYHRRRYMMPRYAAPLARFWYKYDVRLNRTSNPFRFYELYHSTPSSFPNVVV